MTGPCRYLLPALTLLAALIWALHVFATVLDRIVLHDASWWEWRWLTLPGLLALAAMAWAARVDRVAEQRQWRTFDRQQRAAERAARRAADASLTDLADLVKPGGAL